MQIEPTQIDQSGPGVDLSNLPARLSAKMSDPVKDFQYAGNAVTLTFDLSSHENLRLAFEAKEFGDEPHAPPPGPFGDDADFDGVAISVDGVDWYEIQDLRSLRSDRFTVYDIDLDAAVAALGLSYAKEFRIRFCQYDDNPAPMDGIFLHKIELLGDLRLPILHLTMDDNAASSTVLDASASQYNQTFSDPGGNPNTDAHSTAGVVGTALAFDGVDDYILLTPESHKPYLAEDHDCTIIFRWKAAGPDPARWLHILGNYSAAVNEESCFFCLSWGDGLYFQIDEYWPGGSRAVYKTFGNGTDGAWHHYALVRQGETIRFHQDGQLSSADTDAHNTLGLAPDSQSITLGMKASGGQNSPGSMDDFRIYDRALSEAEIAAMV